MARAGRSFGGAEEIVRRDTAIPEPARGEPLVKVLAASVQFTDVMLRKGRYPALKDKPPLVPGHELVGEIVELSSAMNSSSDSGSILTWCRSRPPMNLGIPILSRHALEIYVVGLDRGPGFHTPSAISRRSRTTPPG